MFALRHISDSIKGDICSWILLMLLSSDFNSKNKKTLKKNKHRKVVIHTNPKSIGLVDLGEWRSFEDRAGGDTMIISSLDDTSSGMD